jgi:hypothetical protein
VRLIAFSLILASTLTACDTQTSPREGDFPSLTPTPITCSMPSKAYGPCTAEGTCDGSLHCLATIDGDMCVPPALGPGKLGSKTSCGAKLGGTLNCENAGVCVLACDADADCLGGTVCAEIPGVCVWPSEPAGDSTSTSGAGEMTEGPQTSGSSTTG